MRELAPADDSGVVVASGAISGRTVMAYGTDNTVLGGALGLEGCRRIAEAIDTAVCQEWPLVGVFHSGGARLADGADSMHGFGLVFAAMVRASGRVPQISVAVGPVAGGAAYGPALTDVVIMSREARVFVTGPSVVRSVTGENIDMDRLGGPETHARRSGVAHVVAQDEAEALGKARRLVTLLASPGRPDPSLVGEPQDFRAFLPEASNRAYPVRPLLQAILDRDDGRGGWPPGAYRWEEFQAQWAPNIVVGLGRLAGGTVGLVANNPLRKGGCLDSLSAEKASRFVRMCDAFGIPLVVVVDVPGYLPGVTQEWGGVVRRGAKLLHAFAEATVPRVTLITRKAYGGAYVAMNSRGLGATAVYAWPDAEVAVMSDQAAVDVLYRKVLAQTPEADRPQVRARLIQEHHDKAGGLARALDTGLVDEVVDPKYTRHVLTAALAEHDVVQRGGHGNIPL
ncbi:acyl-CoA carboxylase subunit beta [Amycolatopsis sp. 3B14]|uniref:acyl-CoA carboxylase subunit beta n=1 Tax=Amycolatopsis sp. 3B14 TaxID=3243600 RepID=UPI003D97C55C